MLNADINLSILRQNAKIIKQNVNAKVAFVLKADAYGHGIREVAQALKDIADEFCVATMEEAVFIGELDLHIPINILTYTADEYKKYYQNCPKSHTMSHIIPLVCSMEELQLYKNFTSYNIKLNTGMNRLGVKGDVQLLELAKKIQESGKTLHSVFTHFYDWQHAYNTEQQYNVFMQNVSCLENNLTVMPKLHVCASSSLLLPKHYHLDMVRVGIALYGYDKNKLTTPVMSVYTSILQTFFVKKGEHVGYGSYTQDVDARVAAIRVGYADGYRRKRQGEKRFVSINGVMCEVLGQICMDVTMVDVTNVKLVGGEKVYLLGSGVDGQMLADSYDTIVYEVLTGFNSKRMKRNYIE